MIFRDPPSFDMSKLLPRLFQIGAVLFFVVLPIVRSIVNARKQEAQRKAGRAPTDEDEEELAEDGDERSPTPEELGKRRFEALLRGEQAPPAMPVLPAPVVAARTSGNARRLVELETGMDPAEDERAVARREEADEEAERKLPEDLVRSEQRELARQRVVAAIEYAASSPRRPSVEPVPASAIDAAPPRPAPGPGARERWLFPREPASDPRLVLQRAFVLQELLSRPLALRDPADRPPRR